MGFPMDIFMTIPTGSFFCAGDTHHVQLVAMAADAVPLHDGHGHVRETQHLRFVPREEYSRMLHAVHTLEGRLGDEIRLWKMTIHAKSVASMAASLPTGIGVGHDVTIHAGFGGIREIRNRVGDPGHHDKQPYDNPDKGADRDLPTPRKNR